MNKILTISVAAYNVEQYLDQALASLADDNYVNKLEIFVVDDGGTDDSLAIAKQYEEKYPGSFHAVHKKNGGYGSTVNYSLAHATGRYFKLLDGDDWMDRKGLEEILKKLEECQDDIVITDYYKGTLEDDMVLMPQGNKNNTVASVRTYTTKHPHGMWSIFYRTDLLKASGLKLPEHTLYTDMIYSTVPFAFAKTIHFFEIPVYCYRIGRDGQSISKESQMKHAGHWLKVCAAVYRYYDEYVTGNPYLLFRVARYYTLSLKLLLLFPANTKNRKRLMQYENKMKKRYPAIYHNAVKCGMTGEYIFILRKSHYLAYWFWNFLPDKYKV